MIGDARILVATSSDGLSFGAPQVVDNGGGPGHQLMPTLAFAGGKLMLVFYDLRDTKAQVFGRFVSDTELTNGFRQTIDIRVSLGTPGAAPVVHAVGARVRLPDRLSHGEQSPRAAAGQPSEPADVQARDGAVPRRLHRRRPLPGVRADGSWRLDVQHRVHRRAARVPRGLDRQPRRAAAARRELAELHAPDARRRVVGQPVRPVEDRAGVPGRQRWFAEPERLHRPHRRRPAGRRAGQHQAALDDAAPRLRGVRAEPDHRDQDFPDEGAGAAGGRARLVRTVPAAALHELVAGAAHLARRAGAAACRPRRARST